MKILRNLKSFKSIIIKGGNSFLTTPNLIANKLVEEFSTWGTCPLTSTMTSIDETTFSNSLTHNKDFLIDELDRVLHMGSSLTPDPDHRLPEIYR